MNNVFQEEKRINSMNEEPPIFVEHHLGNRNKKMKPQRNVPPPRQFVQPQIPINPLNQIKL